METYEDHPWYSYSSQSGEEEGEEEGEGEHHHDRHDRHLARVRTRARARVRSRSSSHSRRRPSFLVDELDMLMDKAATTIQASWRGFLVRKHIASEHEAASTIQAAWRRFITKEYKALRQERVPSWQAQRHRRRTPAPATSGDGRRSWERSRADRERAAEVIQAHYRGYMTRRALEECNQAATTIQAHWRGYCIRQEMEQRPRRPGPRAGPSRSYYGYPSYVPASAAWVGPYPRKHWHKCLVGDPEEWASKVPRSPKERQHGEHCQVKVCSQCGRCTGVRVIVGVGKGPPLSESEMDDSECDSGPDRHPSARRKSPASRSWGQAPARPHCSGPHVSHQAAPKAYYPDAHHTVAEDHPRRQGRESGGLSQRYAAMHTSTSMRLTRERNAPRSHSSTSLQQQQQQQQGAVPAGTSDWLYENYCARRMGEGQRRVFKTRKQMWQVARAATLIQSFWRGWKARQVLRQQQEAATKIQSAYRGYKTRVYLIEAGVLSEGETE